MSVYYNQNHPDDPNSQKSSEDPIAVLLHYRIKWLRMSQAPLNNTAQLCLEGCSQLVNIIFPITCLHHRNPVLLRWAQKIWPHAKSQAGGGHPAGDMFLVKFSSKDTKGLSRSVLIQSSLSSWELQKERKNSLSTHCCPACRQRRAFFPITPNIWNSTFLIMVAKRAFYYHISHKSFFIHKQQV